MTPPTAREVFELVAPVLNRIGWPKDFPGFTFYDGPRDQYWKLEVGWDDSARGTVNADLPASVAAALCEVAVMAHLETVGVVLLHPNRELTPEWGSVYLDQHASRTFRIGPFTGGTRLEALVKAASAVKGGE